MIIFLQFLSIIYFLFPIIKFFVLIRFHLMNLNLKSSELKLNFIDKALDFRLQFLVC
jgi:hypothetical protein